MLVVIKTQSAAVQRSVMRTQRSAEWDGRTHSDILNGLAFPGGVMDGVTNSRYAPVLHGRKSHEAVWNVPIREDSQTDLRIALLRIEGGTRG